MEKLYLAMNGKPIQKGDLIHVKSCKEDIVSISAVTVSDLTIPTLKDAGILVTAPPKPLPTISVCIQRIADRLGWKPQRVERLLNTTAEMLPIAAFTIMVREVAVALDEKYPDHINKSEKIFAISPLDGRIHEICKAHIKNYRNFAAFRTIEDAKLACSILREPLKDMFKSGK